MRLVPFLVISIVIVVTVPSGAKEIYYGRTEEQKKSRHDGDIINIEERYNDEEGSIQYINYVPMDMNEASSEDEDKEFGYMEDKRMGAKESQKAKAKKRNRYHIKRGIFGGSTSTGQAYRYAYQQKYGTSSSREEERQKAGAKKRQRGRNTETARVKRGIFGGGTNSSEERERKYGTSSSSEERRQLYGTSSSSEEMRIKARRKAEAEKSTEEESPSKEDSDSGDPDEDAETEEKSEEPEGERRRRRRREIDEIVIPADATEDTQPSETSASQNCAIGGYWYNSRGSELLLTQGVDGSIEGEFRTAVESECGAAGNSHSIVKGYVHGNLVTFHAAFKGTRRQRSMTSWIGQCHKQCDFGFFSTVGTDQTVLSTTWILSTEADGCDEHWSQHKIGQDIFVRKPLSTKGPRKAGGVHTPPRQDSGCRSRSKRALLIRSKR